VRQIGLGRTPFGVSRPLPRTLASSLSRPSSLRSLTDRTNELPLPSPLHVTRTGGLGLSAAQATTCCLRDDSLRAQVAMGILPCRGRPSLPSGQAPVGLIAQCAVAVLPVLATHREENSTGGSNLQRFGYDSEGEGPRPQDRCVERGNDRQSEAMRAGPITRSRRLTTLTCIGRCVCGKSVRRRPHRGTDTSPTLNLHGVPSVRVLQLGETPPPCSQGDQAPAVTLAGLRIMSRSRN